MSNPNYFQKKLEDKAPFLFSYKKKEGNVNVYTKLCQSSTKRQPVIVSDEELEKMRKEYKGKDVLVNGRDVLRYGDAPDRQYNYICPRYWCLLTDSFITEEDVKSGKCGKIIPAGKKEIPKGHYVYEFFDKLNHGSQENYIQHYPGFMNMVTPDGHHPIPCCFKTMQRNVEKYKKNKLLSKKDEKKNRS